MTNFDIDVQVSANSKSKVTEELRTLLKSVKPELTVKVNKQSLNAIRQSVVNKFKDPIPIKIQIDQGSLNAAKQQVANLKNSVAGAANSDSGSSTNVIRGSTGTSGGSSAKQSITGVSKKTINTEGKYQTLLNKRVTAFDNYYKALLKGDKTSATVYKKRFRELSDEARVLAKNSKAYEDLYSQSVAETRHRYNLANAKQQDSIVKQTIRDNARIANEQAKEQARQVKNQKKYLDQYNKLTDLQNNNNRLKRNSELNAEVTQMRRQLLKSAYTKQSDDELIKTNDQYKALQKNLAATGVAEQKLGTIVKNNASKFIKWYGVSQGVMHLQQGMTEMWEAVKNVDTAMTELRKVTDETDGTYSKFYKNATVRARNLGATVSDTINASADFARLGYNIDDAAKLADAATVYKNVGDGIEDIGTASSSIISTMKAFNVEAKDSMKIVDMMNEVGNKYAIGSAGIGEALLRSASSLASGGNSLEESIGMITAMNEIVQDPQVVGKIMPSYIAIYN